MNAYVAAGYGVTLLGLGVYALHVLRRARSLSDRLGGGAGPTGRRR